MTKVAPIAAEGADWLLSIALRAIDLAVRYVEAMEDYDAGFPISNPDHPHHEDWVNANELIRDAGRKVSAVYAASCKPKEA